MFPSWEHALGRQEFAQFQQRPSAKTGHAAEWPGLVEKTIHSEGYRFLVKRLKAERERRKLTMREVAVRINAHHTWVVKVENRDRRLDLVEYVRYCRALNINPHKGITMLERVMAGEE